MYLLMYFHNIPSVLSKSAIPQCEVLGACYILLMTLTAYNLLALLVNEEYQCDLANSSYIDDTHTHIIDKYHKK